MSWGFNYYFILCIIFYQLLHLPQTESLIGPGLQDAKKNEFTHTVAVVRANSWTSTLYLLCTGIYIAEKYVLTAASCVHNELHQHIRIYATSNELYQCDSYGVISWKSYKHWACEKGIDTKDSEHDIAIITLSEPLNLKPPALLIPPNQLNRIPIFRISGWGKSHNSTDSIVLQTANVKILSKRECESKISKIEKTDVIIDESRYFCTVADPYVQGDHKNGDKGDPIHDKNGYLMGFLVKGYGNEKGPSNEKVNLHIDINFYRDFIIDEVKHSRIFFSFSTRNV